VKNVVNDKYVRILKFSPYVMKITKGIVEEKYNKLSFWKNGSQPMCNYAARLRIE